MARGEEGHWRSRAGSGFHGEGRDGVEAATTVTAWGGREVGRAERWGMEEVEGVEGRALLLARQLRSAVPSSPPPSGITLERRRST